MASTGGTPAVPAVSSITRRIYDGDVDAVKSPHSERKLPVDPILMERLEKLGKGEWVFRSRTGASKRRLSEDPMTQRYGEESISVAMEEVTARDWVRKVYEPDIKKHWDNV